MLQRLFLIGPLLFAALFLWPLLVQSLARLGVQGAAVTAACGVAAIAAGLVAQVRGRWL